jgi:tripartite-type tricarboxylate transporter receptor subunit TctC
MRRRQVLGLAASALVLPTEVWSQNYPTRPVRLTVGYAAGGVNDVLARLMGQYLAEHLGQSFVVENRPGAGSNIATEAVVRAAPDGYTLLLASTANAINATLYDKLGFDFARDIAPVASICRVPNVMLINPSVPATTVPEFIAYVKANPGKISMASAGNGSPQHVAGELFKMMAGVDMVHIPYRGGAPALTDLLAGQVQVYFSSVASAIQYIKAGKLRALAVTTSTRSELLPDLPTMAEFLPGYEASPWYGIAAPKATPADVINKLNEEINKGLADPAMRARLAELGATPLSGSPADFGRLLVEETDKWAKVVKMSGAKPD